ncbi:hypothetical protein H1Z61_10960 [Bacillus aquiflavi]|uniref:DUF2974 domain-containing protein n=1 Tax=Bacillus aquiflavi TaxID=2672567 RepID=A0A6B3W324_9BACI|nr:hypothetical protein [Bacillus aquiflavi]MBA4537637.1 hypothetical protein [Bacillus aquiflavi]NEY81894.1 hypothetical protein [Bacillus aquiflavi]
MTTIQRPATDDKDLVELAGYHAYREYSEQQKIIVNGKKFKVVHTNYNHPTGLDALTVKNVKTGEYTVVYVGTDIHAENGKQDLITDIQFLSDLTPEQIKEARKYFNEMDKEFGISSICGNSLGGGLTNSVAIEHPDVKAVTLNPAILPDKMVDPNKDYSNMTNYFSLYDVLTRAETALQMHDRIPGKQFTIKNGIPILTKEKIGTNHTGFLRNKDKTQYYPIGDEEEPGNGNIYIDADEHIVLSIWTGEPLYEGSSERIEINKENLDLLAHALKNNVKPRLERADTYLTNSIAIVEDEGEKFSTRIDELKNSFLEFFQTVGGNPISNGLSLIGDFFHSKINRLIFLLNDVERKALSLNIILNSSPVELVEYILKIDLSVESVIGEARGFLYRIKALIDEFLACVYHIQHEKIPALFEGGKDMFVDAIVGELHAHFDIINLNKEKVVQQLTDFATLVAKVAEAFEKRDESLAQAIKNNQGIDDVTLDIQPSLYCIQESPYMEEKMNIKEIHLELAFTNFTHNTETLLTPILTALQTVLDFLATTIETIAFTIKQVPNMLTLPPGVGKVLKLFGDFREKVRTTVDEISGLLQEMAATVEGVSQGINALVVNYPQFLSNFRQYFDTALFGISKYFNVHLYNLAAIAILEEMELLFNDIIYQLSNHKAKAIDALCEMSKSVSKNIKLLNEQVDRVKII